jgi:hypothetical protein
VLEPVDDDEALVSTEVGAALVIAEGNTVELKSLVIAEPHRGPGLGRAAVEFFDAYPEPVVEGGIVAHQMVRFEMRL